MQQRIGCGFDVHQLVAGRSLVLGGVTIAHTHGLAGHSDADVLCHALIDALLGAVALADIGQHFPSTEERWRGASSLELLATVVARLSEQGWDIGNVDATVIAQSPRLDVYREAMRTNLARTCGVALDAISVKATTTEGLGFVGKAEGMAAQVVVLVTKQVKI